MINIDFLVCVIWLRDKCETQVPQERIYKNYIKFKFKTDYEKAREIIRWLFAIFPHNLV